MQCCLFSEGKIYFRHVSLLSLFGYPKAVGRKTTQFETLALLELVHKNSRTQSENAR